MSAPSQRGWRSPSATMPARSPLRSALCTTCTAPRTMRSVASVAGPGGCGYPSISTTTSAARSVSRSVTCRLPRRALTGQLTVRNWSPGTYRRISAYSTPGPMCRVRWVPSRSSSSVRGIAVDCGGANGNTKTSAASATPVPCTSPPRETTFTRATIGYRPHLSAATTTVWPWRGPARRSRAACRRRSRS